jgi:hypothetical protein
MASQLARRNKMFPLSPATIDRGLFSAMLFGPLPIAYWATLAHHDRQALPGLPHEGAPPSLCVSDKSNKISWLPTIKWRLVFPNLWPVTCTEGSVRIALKPVNGSMASIQGTATKGSGGSFLDMLAQASSLAASKPALAVTASKGSSSDTADRDSEDQTSEQPISASENEAVDVQAISIAGSTIRKSASVTANGKNQNAELGSAVSTMGSPASSARSQSQSKTSQPVQHLVADSVQQAGDQSAAQQIIVSLPVATLPEVSFGRSIQSDTGSSTAYAKQPSLPAVLASNANAAAQTGNDGSAASQSALPASPSLAVTPSEVSFSRSTQWEAASPIAYAKQPALPAVLQANADSAAQTGSNGAATTQSSVPPSASPAVTLPEISFGGSTQWQAASSTASAEPTAPPAVQWSNGNSAAQTASTGSATTQTSVPPSASPAVTLPEISFGRSTQWQAASAAASAALPAIPAVQLSNGNSAAQTASDGSATTQTSVPPSASPAVTLPEISFGGSMQWQADAQLHAASPAALPAIPAAQFLNASAAAQTGTNGAATSQSALPSSVSPAVALSGVSLSRSTQHEAAAPKSPVALPAFPAAEWSSTDSVAQSGSDGAVTGQSATPQSASPAVAQPGSSFSRTVHDQAGSPTPSAAVPATPAMRSSNANSAAQTASDAAATSQTPVPASASPAATDPSLLSKASAAQFFEQSAFAVGSTFSPSMILSNGDDAATLTDKASQFKSSGATFTTNSGTVNSGDTNSSKATSAPASTSADHSAQNGNPSPQHASADSSPATPLAIKPLEASATQTTPVSNHTALASPSQPHAASSANDVLTKAQASADAAAEQLDRTGTTAAGGINTARLMQSMSESEMRVGMHSAEFGDISIRTSVSQQQLMAQISVDHGELGNAIAAHLPLLASKLGGDFGLHASIEVNQLGGSVSGGNGQSSQQNQKMTPQSVPADSSALSAEDDRMTIPAQSFEADGSRLDIRA